MDEDSSSESSEEEDDDANETYEVTEDPDWEQGYTPGISHRAKIDAAKNRRKVFTFISITSII